MRLPRRRSRASSRIAERCGIRGLSTQEPAARPISAADVAVTLFPSSSTRPYEQEALSLLVAGLLRRRREWRRRPRRRLRTFLPEIVAGFRLLLFLVAALLTVSHGSPPWGCCGAR